MATLSDKVRKLLTKNPNLTAAEVAEKLNVSKPLVYSIKAKLKAEPEVTEPVLEAVEVVEEEVSQRQVGGKHYTVLPIQPWEVIENNDMGFFDGNALKYIMRFRAKGGVEDLEKARHYLDKLIEMEHGRNA